MKFRELILWILVIAAIAMSSLNYMQNNMQHNIIEIILETQDYIIDLMDVKVGWYLM